MSVWVHASGGDVVGHVPAHVADSLAPWMFDGGRAGAVVTKVGGDDTESWKRIEIEIEMG